MKTQSIMEKPFFIRRESADCEHWIGEHRQTIYFEKDIPVAWDEDINKYLRFQENHNPFSNWQLLFIKLTRKHLNIWYKVSLRNRFRTILSLDHFKSTKSELQKQAICLKLALSSWKICTAVIYPSTFADLRFSWRNEFYGWKND